MSTMQQREKRRRNEKTYLAHAMEVCLVPISATMVRKDAQKISLATLCLNIQVLHCCSVRLDEVLARLHRIAH
jgi:hypothetical protein